MQWEYWWWWSRNCSLRIGGREREHYNWMNASIKRNNEKATGKIFGFFNWVYTQTHIILSPFWQSTSNCLFFIPGVCVCARNGRTESGACVFILPLFIPIIFYYLLHKQKRGRRFKFQPKSEQRQLWKTWFSAFQKWRRRPISGEGGCLTTTTTISCSSRFWKDGRTDRRQWLPSLTHKLIFPFPPPPPSASEESKCM